MVTLLIQICNNIYMLLNEMAPYLLLGFGVAGLLSVLVSQDQIKNKIGSQNFSSNIKAVLYGIPLPLCSCGVIPVATSLKKHGASRGAVISFLTATPQTGVDSIALTYGMLGLPILILKLIIALLSGLVAGITANFFDQSTINNEDTACEDECCDDEKGSIIKRALIYGFRTLPKDIVEPLLIGLILAGVIGLFAQNYSFITLIPESFLGSILKILVIMIISVPLYICATASIPLALMIAIMLQSPGAAIALLIAGPATNMSTIMTCLKIIGKKSTIIYVGTIFIAALISGVIADNLDIIKNSMPTEMPHIHNHDITLFSLICMLMLLVVLFIAITHKKKINISGNSTILNIKGMTCSHCESNVEKGLGAVYGMQAIKADHKKGTVVINSEEQLDMEKIKAIIQSYNYELILDD